MNKDNEYEKVENRDENADFCVESPVAEQTGATQNETTVPAPEPVDADPGAEEDGKTRSHSALQALRDLTSEEDEPSSSHKPLTLGSLLGGDILGGGWFRRNFGYIVMLVFMAMIYVSSRYTYQQRMLENKMLTDTLLDRRYKALTRSSELKEKTRRSFIEESLADTTIQTAKTPSYHLKVEE